jgi:hypothetical protein
MILFRLGLRRGVFCIVMESNTSEAATAGEKKTRSILNNRSISVFGRALLC